MADDVKSCGKKRSSIDCEEDCPFHRIGLPIMPLRYAVLRNDDTSPALTGDMLMPELTERPLGDSARYGVRLLRPGYLYVYDEARSELKGYYVNENSTLYNFDLDKPVDACDRTFTCTMDHQAKASLLTIPDARKATFVWLAFSDVQWTKDVCKAHKGRKGAEMRQRHMFKFDVQAWLGSGKHASAKSIKTLNDTAADYVMYRRKDLDLAQKKPLLGWSTVGIHDTQGWMGGMIQDAAEAFQPGKGLLLALPDSTGILQDIARLMRMRFDDFVSNPEDVRPLTVSKSIESLSEIIMQSAESDLLRQRGNDASNQAVYGTTTPNMGAGPGGSGAGGLAVAQPVSYTHLAWTEAQVRQELANEKLAGDNQQALTTAAAAFEQHSTSLLQTLGQSQADLQAALAARDQERLAAWTGELGAMAEALRQEWEQAGARSASLQQEICATLAQTAQDIATQTEAHASGTIAEISQLVQAASEAPRAAAEVIGELRQKLSDSLAYDNAMLEERNRLLDTLATLLDAVNHASAEQRSAVDALVSSSADLLDRVGTQFTEQVESETARLDDLAAQVTSGAVEVASLGEAFGAAVRLFGESNDKLVAHLQRIESALDKSIARGDEQLAYYVAQAREVVDLSTMSQKQIVENLRDLASQRAATAGAQAA